MMGDATEMPGATARAVESSKAKVGATDIVPESRAQRPAALEEQATHPEMPQGVVDRFMRPPSSQGAPPAVEEEDGVEEIERGGSQPQTVRIFRKRGEEIMVVEEEDTTREVKRLWSTLCIAMKQIEVSVVSVVSVFSVGDCGLL